MYNPAHEPEDDGCRPCLSVLTTRLLRLYTESPEPAFWDEVGKLTMREAKQAALDLEEISRSAAGCAKDIRHGILGA